MLTDLKTSTISIIIPTLNEEETLAFTLAILIDQPAVEVIVVDGGSTDQTMSVAQAAGVRVLAAPGGRARQMNCGAAQAAGEILLFLHADTLLPAGFAEQVRKAMNTPGIAAGAFRLAIAGPAVGLRIIEKMANLRSIWWGLPYGDQAIFLSTVLFKKIGGFPDQPIMEDFVLVRRIARQGRIAILPCSATTSARRWQALGLVRTTLLNQIIVLAYLYGISPQTLAGWYRRARRN